MGNDIGAVPGPQAPAATDGLVADRCAWSLVWLGVLAAGLSSWGMWSSSAALTVVAPVLVLVATVGIVVSWLSASPRARNFQLLTLMIVVVAAVASQYGAIHGRRFYSSDSAAFNQVAAQTLIQGQDPYKVSMASAHYLLSTPAHYWTDTVTGGHITDVSYPAGSFLLIRGGHASRFPPPGGRLGGPAGLVGGRRPSFRAAAGRPALDGRVAPARSVVRGDLQLGRHRCHIPSLPDAGRVAVGPLRRGPYGRCGRLDRPGGTRPRLRRQTGTLVLRSLPARRRRPRGPPGRSLPLATAARYGATVLAVFGVVNLPFIVWGPGAWLHGSLTPFVEPLVADGQGLVSLATHGFVRGVDLTDLTVCGALVFLTVLAAFVTTYPLLKRAWLVALPLGMFFSPRSLSSYLVDFLPVALLAAVSVGSAGEARRRVPVGRGRRWTAMPVAVCAVPALGAVVAGVLAFSGPPLAITVRHVETGMDGATMTALTVSVRNLTDSPEVPHVMVTMGSSYSAGFWLPRRGPMAPIPPHGQTTVTLYPPVVTAAAPLGAEWLVAAYTKSPEALEHVGPPGRPTDADPGFHHPRRQPSSPPWRGRPVVDETPAGRVTGTQNGRHSEPAALRTGGVGGTSGSGEDGEAVDRIDGQSHEDDSGERGDDPEPPAPEMDTDGGHQRKGVENEPRP